jgi:DNA-binding NtrC family response regulator
LICGQSCAALDQVARLAARAGAAIIRAETAATAAALARAQPDIGLVLCDVSCGVAGLLGQLRAALISLPVIATGETLDVPGAVAAIKAGAVDVLVLPADDLSIRRMLLQGQQDAQAPEAADPAMLAVLRLAKDIAGSDASVLITGESGTGKEVVARHIHTHSHRAAGPFVAVNCAAIPDGLLESELFGHEKGAFSGALARRIGKFEAAQGGTLLLDEITEMDVRLQAKILRVIQEKVVDRVGGTVPIRVNARLLATSNRDMRRACAEGKFREDLYFRLNVINIAIPALRQRPADILPLAERFARHFAALNGVPVKQLEPAFAAFLQSHAWPGNVRELENTIHRAVLLSPGSELTRDAVGPAVAAARPVAVDGQAKPMSDVERDHIIETLNRTEGNRTQAAALLGISIRALRNKLKAYAQTGVAVPPAQIHAAA